MTRIETLKAQAQNLKHAMDKMGIVISLAQALEAIAGQYGMENWDTLAGIVNKNQVPAPTVPTLADLPGKPNRVEVVGCSGLRFDCVVKQFDLEALALVHDEAALRRFVRNNQAKYPQGLGTTVVDLVGDNRDLLFTLSDLIGIKYDGGYWYLSSGMLALGFYDQQAPGKQSTSQVELAIPQMVKSAKGCELVVLRSHDGAQYDRQVIVPPHLNVETISAKLAAEIRRLKEIDKANEENDNYNGYTDEDIARYVGGIGCLWVSSPTVVAENWD